MRYFLLLMAPLLFVGAEPGFTRRYYTSRIDVRVFPELISFTNRENVFAYDYERDVNSSGALSLCPPRAGSRVASVGMSWTCKRQTPPSLACIADCPT